MKSDRSIGRVRRFGVLALSGTGLFLLAAASPARLSAQEYESWDASERFAEDLGQRGSGFELTGYIGVFAPLASLADQGDTLKAELSTSVSFSAGLDYWFDGGFGIGVLGGYARPEMTVFQVQEAGQFPLELNLGRADYAYGMATLQYRPNLSGNEWSVRPYFLLGGGVRYLGEPEDNLGIGETALAENSTKPVLAFGGGAHVIISGSWFMRLDVRDLVSSFDSELFPDGKVQHDLFISFGVGYSFH